MNGIAVLISLAAIGVDYGWQPLPDGRLEYIVQIEPGLLEELKAGEEISSEILPQARNLRRLRIRVGTGEVPRVGHLQDNTTPQSVTPQGTGSSPEGGPRRDGSAVLPPQSGSESVSDPPGSGPSAHVGPDGFLNLPPPPPLLGADGKNSVLVLPGSRSRDSESTAGEAQDVLPPDAYGNRSGTSASERSGADGASDSSPNDTGAGQTPRAGGGPGSNSRPRFGGGIYPPSAGGDSAPTTGSDSAVLPPTGDSSSGWPVESDSPAADQSPVRPVREPNPESGLPNPIRFGETGVKPPTADSEATHGPLSGSSPSKKKRSSGDTETGSNEQDLLARHDASRTEKGSKAAAFKPSMDKETAEDLEPKPWTPLVLTSLALFASLAANAYLGWVALGIYRRYRDIVGQLHQAQTSPA